MCGGVYKEERFRVMDCYVTLEVNMPLTVRVWTNLDTDARDESFAIDNVEILMFAKGYLPELRYMLTLTLMLALTLTLTLVRYLGVLYIYVFCLGCRLGLRPIQIPTRR